MTENRTFLTTPVQIAPSGKSIEEANKDLAEVLKQIKDNTFSVEKLLNLAAMKKSEVETLKSQTPADITARVARDRRKLLLKIALGSAPESDLAKFDKSAAEEQKAIAKQSVPKEAIENLEQTLAEAKDEIGSLIAEGSRLQEKRRLAALDLCRAKFEALGEEYVRLSHEMRLIVAKVVAWGDLHRSPKLGGSSEVGGEVERISLMPLGTDSTHNRTPFFSANEMRPLYDAATDEALAWLQAEGLELFPPAPPVLAPAKSRAPGLGVGTPVSIARPPEPLRTEDGSIAPSEAIHEFNPLNYEK